MILLDINKKVPLYEQLFRELRNQIISGDLGKDAKLKPIRVLAKELQISHNTVNSAYQQLLAEGYVRSVVGSGYYVEELFLFKQQRQGDKDKVNIEKSENVVPKVTYDFNPEKISTDLIPWNQWKREITNAINEESYDSNQNREKSKGNRKLREKICEYILNTRGVHCEPEQIIVTTDRLHAIEIIMDILPRERYTVGVENPSDYKIHRVLEKHKCKLLPIDILDSGIDANELEDANCDLLYVTPSHQFPTGVTLSLYKRLQILEWSRREKVYIIEDDTDNEFLFGERPVLSMQSMDRNERVIYMSSISKILSVGLNCTYMVLPMSLIGEYEKKYHYYAPAMAKYEQIALANIIESGQLDRQARKVSISSLKKNRAMREWLQKYLQDEIKIYPYSGGSHFLIEIEDVEDGTIMLRHLQLYGIYLYDINKCWCKEIDQKNIYMLGFSAIDEEDIPNACKALADAIHQIKELSNG